MISAVTVGRLEDDDKVDGGDCVVDDGVAEGEVVLGLGFPLPPGAPPPPTGAPGKGGGTGDKSILKVDYERTNLLGIGGPPAPPNIPPPVTPVAGLVLSVLPLVMLKRLPFNDHCPPKQCAPFGHPAPVMHCETMFVKPVTQVELRPVAPLLDSM